MVNYMKSRTTLSYSVHVTLILINDGGRTHKKNSQKPKFSNLAVINYFQKPTFFFLRDTQNKTLQCIIKLL